MKIGKIKQSKTKQNKASSQNKVAVITVKLILLYSRTNDETLVVVACVNMICSSDDYIFNNNLSLMLSSITQFSQRISLVIDRIQENGWKGRRKV